MAVDRATVAKIAKLARIRVPEDQLDALAELMFHQPGPTFATAKIALTDEPWALPEKDGAVIARRFRGAVGAAG